MLAKKYYAYNYVYVYYVYCYSSRVYSEKYYWLFAFAFDGGARSDTVSQPDHMNGSTSIVTTISSCTFLLL